MLVNNEQLFERIDEIVEQAYIDFTFDIIGDDFFSDEQKIKLEALGLIIGRRPLIELLYILVRQRSTPGYRKDQTLNELLSQIQETGKLPVINDAHRYAIDHAKSQISESINGAIADVRKKTKQEILKVNNEYRNDVAVGRLTTLPNIEEKKQDYTSALLLGLGLLSTGVHKNFMRTFTTAMTDTVNNAVVDEASTQVAAGESVGEIKVYKEVVNDASLCRWCNSFYTNLDGTPKEYSLASLQANGSNDGKPKSAWKPVVGSTHPRCRCQLQYVKK